ncbi:CHAT domain-containing protein [Candidatus Protochlamydia sp. R18]|uniref:CHAT domain-containing protein n=1 Tax=Candidatus Protochlamydia sp. R18 TaxID=1353977 RepID=UPI0005A7CDBD|nr:CHAT domain-containing protein [Candidatus Protochlamydia sp. R18]
MNVNSIQFSTLYNSLIFQNLPTLSILDHVKGLIEAYKTKFVTEENIIISAKWLIEKVNQLEDFSVQRECFCRLLILEMEDVQNLIVQEVVPLFDFKTFLYDIQHEQAQELIDLERIVSEILETKLTSGQFNFLVPICIIYQRILEHLWLLPYLEFGNHCSNLLAQNKGSILSHMKGWIESLYQLANEKKIEFFIPKNVENSVLRLFEPLPETVAKEIKVQKTAIHKNRKLPLEFLAIMAEFYGKQGDFPCAISYAEVLLGILTKEFPEMSQNKELFNKVRMIHGNLATWNKSLKRYQSAIYHSKEALKIAEVLNESHEVFIYLKNIGSFYAMQGQDDCALLFYSEAQTIAQKLTDPKIKSRTLVDLAEVYLSLDKNEEAIQCYQDALSLTVERIEQAHIYTRIGHAQAKAQRYQTAEEAYHDALNILPPDKFLEAIKIHENLATLFNHLDKYETAIFHAEKILELTQHPSVQIDESQVLNSKFGALTTLGKIYTTIEDREKGLDYHTQALSVAEKLKTFSEYLGPVYTNLGATSYYLESDSESINYYIKALEITEDRLKRAKLLINLGHAFYRCGKFAEAVKYYKEAVEISDKTEIKSSSFNGLGLCYINLGNEKKAIQSFEKFVCLSQELQNRRKEAIGYHNLGVLYSKTDASLAKKHYQKSIGIYAALHQELKSHRHWQIIFFEEQVKPLLCLEFLFLQQVKTEKALQVTDFRRSRALVSALTEKFQFQKNNSFFSSGLTSQNMQALAHKMSTCFIVYSFASENMDSITIWVIPPQGEITCQQLPLGILTEEFEEATYVFQTFPFIAETRTVKMSLSSFLEELTRGESDENIHLSNSQAFKKRLKNWYEILITPIEDYLPKDPQQVVTIIPDGYLAQIPFAAFLDKKGTYLIEKHPISIAPSIGILKLLEEIPKKFSKNSLVIGNPTTPYSKDSLPFAEKEAQKLVSPLLKTAPERILLQDSATVQHVVEGMRDARWIHLACHGTTGTKPEEKLDSHSVFEGLFKLAPDESHPQGYLHAQEIAALTLHSELVFMSTCFSGRGKLHGEGSVGPVWSFLAAGALSTVATYWRLPDSDLTLQMVDTFYRHLLGIGEEKLNKAQALQKAMLMAIEQKREKPHLWGAFFLSGLSE